MTAKVLLIDLVCLIDDKTIHPGGLPLRGIRQQSEARHQMPLDDVIVLPTWCMPALFGQNLEEVTMEWNWTLCTVPGLVFLAVLSG